MTESVLVYRDTSCLNTESRKALYKEILEEDRFGERSKRFTRALKTLMFKGEIESYEQGVDDESTLTGRRENDLTHLLPIYLCLASPEVSVDFFAEILGRYSKDFQIGMQNEIIGCGLDGNFELSDEYYSRVIYMLRALARLAPRRAAAGLLGGYNLAVMFNKFLAVVKNKCDSSRCFLAFFRDDFDASFVEVQQKAGRSEVLIVGLLETLFGSAYPASYEDEGFITFCSKYFSRTFGSELLAYLDAIYNSIPEDKRIRWDGSKILYSTQ